MKHSYLPKLWFLLFFLICCTLSAAAQTGSVSGRVLDEKQQALPGVTVLIEGTQLGSSTNADGQFLIQNVPAGQRTVVTSFVGYSTQRSTVTVTAGQTANVTAITLGENTTLLNEAVVIGYGVQRRQDVTGSVTTVDSRQFVKGQITNPEQLVQGKIAGVQINTGSGQPGAAAAIRIRGGASLTASNDPLIIIDNVPVDNRGLSGTANPLSLINPNDIESITVLKDASATAIYGSRASNGVILVTTKKGVQGEQTSVNVSSQLSRSEASKFVDVLSAQEFRDLVNARGNAQQKALLTRDSDANTDWQKLIYRKAWTSDNNASVTGSIGKVPYRASAGYLYQEGLLKNNDLRRNTASIGFSPLLLNDNLKIDVNVKGAWIDNNFSNQDAVGAAVYFDPTKPVTNGSPYGGYTEIERTNDNNQLELNTLATRNPVGLINQKRDRSTVKRSIGNIQLDYKMPFLTDLRANLNLGYDIQRGRGTNFIPATAASNYNDQIGTSRGGLNNRYAQDKNNKLLEFYLAYNKQLGESRLDLLAGHSYQSFEDKNYVFGGNLADGTQLTAPARLTNGKNYRDPRYVLISFFGRANYNINDKYLLTATMRADGSSRFSEDNRWGYFPSGAVAWRLKGEDFLKESGVVSELKLRAGVGQTGQQDIVGELYPYLARYTASEETSLYPFGTEYYSTLRAAAYYAPIKWETTTTYNLGLDYGFLDNRLSGAIEVYMRDTKDLLNNVFIPGGSNLSNKLTTNVGSLENRGIEASLSVDVVRGEKLNWTLNANATAYRVKITELTNAADPSYLGDQVGGIAGGNGNNVQINSVGYSPNTFYVFQQVYNSEGKPVEGVYVDRNGDGTINDSDKYRYKSPIPRATLGFGSNLSYGKASLAFTLRSNLGNYVYNNLRSQSFFPVGGSNGVINNTTREALESGFGTPQYFSDYYIENASFLRMENLTLGYNVGSIYKDKARLNITLAAQNLFVVTKYSGIDPEIVSFDTSGKVSNVGIDNVIYPRPRTYTLGLNLSF